jgi:hypothetical protein
VPLNLQLGAAELAQMVFDRIIVQPDAYSVDACWGLDQVL